MATQKSENRSGLRNVLLVVLALFILMIMTTGVAYVVAKNIAGGSVKYVESSRDQVAYNAGEFLTNLADKGYIKLSMVYLLNDKQCEKEVVSKDSEIRDKVFTILRSKTHDSVKDSNGMEELRKEIKEALNQLLNGGRIVDVYFTDIIVN
ncbi:MAG TPA: flagellar basal body protein FliL [Thermoanaerobacterales bacterium]|uniref:flagellar basal body-associated FliL family protein n=1 Tax=Tepidanaerobacter sp. GT38 TaxID=2722793 RepID=UPI0017CE14F4|nr:flagellar basal body-associated FliL family protein [Tepidanaerobacter sp. GT38]MCG1011720.1 flagellar basal body-associated FliL family protein [Tepidanaerobacter sp. GT38]HHY41908.1 flagellar basal body protein FliL [Thermoanaerobacterales bacterium]